MTSNDTFQKIVEKVITSADIEKDLYKKVREVISRITVDEIEALLRPIIFSKIELEVSNLLTNKDLWDEIYDKVEESITSIIKPMLEKAMMEFTHRLTFSFDPKHEIKQEVKQEFDTRIIDKLMEMKNDKIRKLITSNKLVTSALPKTKEDLIRIIIASNPTIAKNGKIVFIKK
jgi:hypothetical protein